MYRRAETAEIRSWSSAKNERDDFEPETHARKEGKKEEGTRMGAGDLDATKRFIGRPRPIDRLSWKTNGKKEERAEEK